VNKPCWNLEAMIPKTVHNRREIQTPVELNTISAIFFLPFSLDKTTELCRYGMISMKLDWMKKTRAKTEAKDGE
jgi:hypothetical protein